MKYIFYIFLFVVLFNSCSNTVDKAKAIIPADSMANILADVHLADATLSVIMNKEKFTQVDNYYSSVLQKYNISKARLDSSISYYSSRGDEFEKIYEDVMFILSEKEGITVAEKEEEKPKIHKVKKYELVYSYKSNFEENTENKLLDNKSTIKAQSGKFSVLFDYNTKKSKEFIYSPKFSISEIKLVFKSAISLMANKTKTAPSIVIEVLNDRKVEQQTAIDLKEYIVEKQEWSNIDIKNNISLPSSIDEGEIKIYISNPYKNDFFIDNFDLQIYVR